MTTSFCRRMPPSATRARSRAASCTPLLARLLPDYELTVYVDGVENEELADWADLINKGEDKKLGYTGATLDVYVDKDAETLTLVVLNQYLAQVDSIDENDDDEDLLDIDFDVFGEGSLSPWMSRNLSATKRTTMSWSTWATDGAPRP